MPNSMSPEVIGSMPPLERAKVLYNVDLENLASLSRKFNELAKSQKFEEMDRLQQIAEEYQANNATLERLNRAQGQANEDELREAA